MTIKKLFVPTLAVFVAIFMTTFSANAADINISGSIYTAISSYTNTSPGTGASTGTNIYATLVQTPGTADSYSHLETWFYEAEMKFKSSGETANGWKTFAELEFELGQDSKNDFEIEEASASVDFGGYMVSMGILEDWSTDTGAVYNWGINEWDTKFGDESPAARITLTGNKQIHADIKFRFHENSVGAATGGTDTTPVARTETRIQAKYNFGMGSARLIYATAADSALVSDAGGDYAYAATNTELFVKLSFGAFRPFISILNQNSKATKAPTGSAETETKFAQTLLGTDFFLSATQGITFNYMTQSLDVGGMDTPFASSILGLGAFFRYAPVSIVVTYASLSNNYKEAAGVGEDDSQSVMTAGFSYGF